MKNKKMVFWLVLIITAVIPVYAQEYDSEKDFEFGWDKNVKNGIAITNYIGKKKEINIPPSIQNNPVTTIGGGDNSFRSITKVIIPDSVKYILPPAFGKTDITSIIIPGSVYQIGYGIPKNTVYSESSRYVNGAFNECKNLVSVTIENGVKIIGNGTFVSCSKLASITIPNSVIEIGHYAFGYCASLKNVIIPDSVTKLGAWAFESCGLTSVNIPSSITVIDRDTFKNCKSLTSVTIPDSVTNIQWNAFENCTSLKSVTIPKSVTKMGGYVFKGCTSLTSVTFEGNITSRNFNDEYNQRVNNFPGDLQVKYLANDGGPGTYTRFEGSDVWKKQ